MGNIFHCLNISVVSQYVNYVVLTGLVSLRALSLPEWELHFIVPPSYILLRPGNSLPSSHLELVRLLHKLQRLISDWFPVPSDSAIDTWSFRSQEEDLYGPYFTYVVFTDGKGHH